MGMKPVQEPMIDAMGSYLNRLSRRQQIVASNLANIDTPGYKTKDISFNATMQELLSEGSLPLRVSRTEHNSMSSLSSVPREPEVFEVQGLLTRADHNNVDLDREMLKLGETSFGYAVMTQLLRTKFKTLVGAITDGR